MYAIGMSLFSQVPQGINYQAVARNSNNQLIENTTIDVLVSILSDTVSTVIAWQEEHTVTTNSYGLFSLTIGDPEATRTAGSALSFDDIDWTASPLYLSIKIFDDAWYEMEPTKLWSVPYAMLSEKSYENISSPFLINNDTVYIMDNLAVGTDSPMKAKLSVRGTDDLSEDALFEVKRADGQTVFAVYSEGVRVYVPTDPATKGPKGGFAIGGFDRTKGEYTEDYMYVTADSIRMYIDKTPEGKGLKGGFAIGGFDRTKNIVDDYIVVNADSTRIYIDDSNLKGLKGGFAIGGFDRTKANRQDYMKITQDSTRFYIDNNVSKGPKGGFAIGGFDRTKGNGISYFDVATDTSGIINPSENRVSWYPLKNAFITGKVLVESRDSVGTNSMATGFESKSIGDYSQAFGFKAIARGDFSTAIGKNAIAEKNSSFAFGDEAEANGANSFSFGQYAKADSTESYAFGKGAIAEGFRSFAFGSSGIDSAGVETGVAHARGDYSFAFGQGSISSGFGSFTLGLADTASGDYSTALGYKTSASGFFSLATGIKTKASGHGSTAIGMGTSAIGPASTALGISTSAEGIYSIAIGALCNATEYSSTAMGHGARADGYNSVAVGSYTTAGGDASTALGYSIEVAGDYSFGIGLSSYSYTINQNNTMAIMGGKVGIGKANPSHRLDVYDNASSYVTHIRNTGNTYLSHGLAIQCGPNNPVDQPTWMIGFNDGDGTPLGSVQLRNGTLTFSSLCDSTLKTNITSTSVEGLELVNSLRVVDYEWKKMPDKLLTGFIAQEVNEIIPDAVSKGPEGIYQLSKTEMIPVLTKAIQEQNEIIEEKDKEIQSLRERLERIEAVLGIVE